MKKNVDIIIGVIASRGNLYDNLVKEYWQHIINYANKNYNGKIKIYLMYGKEFDKNYFNYLNEKDLFVCNYKDSLRPGILKKTVDFMKYIDENYNCKQLFRTNLSSFLVLDNMLEVFKALDISNNYAGPYVDMKYIVKNHPLQKYVNYFISGSGIWFSKDIVKYILFNKNSINYNIHDDVEIAKILENKTKGLSLLRLDILKEKSWISGEKTIYLNKKSDLNNIFFKSILIINKGKYYHIRIKAYNLNQYEPANHEQIAKIQKQLSKDKVSVCKVAGYDE